MGIHHSDFDKMFNCLKDETPMMLSEAVSKWKLIKDTGEDTMIGWIELLEEVSQHSIDRGELPKVAMTEAWNHYEGLIIEDSKKWHFHISELRDNFFNDSIDKLS